MSHASYHYVGVPGTAADAASFTWTACGLSGVSSTRFPIATVGCNGCFAKYLYRIGRRNNTDCDFCGEVDDVYHTLRDCPAWDTDRIRLKCKLDLDKNFALGDILDAILESEEKWKTFSMFVEKIMREKEDEKRRRERVGHIS